jgi:hypothetical protein
LIELAEGRSEWVVGFLDETWWSRLARPALHSWSDAGVPLRLIEQSIAKDDPDPKAISSATDSMCLSSRRYGCASWMGGPLAG